MTLTYGDRVQETFTTTGTGTVSLGGAVTGYQAFSAIVANAGTCYYAATDGTNWEVGLGTYATSGNTLARTTIIASSNSGSAVNWSAGTKNIWLDMPATSLQTPLNIQKFTSSGTYTPSAGMVMATIECWGGGGGGGASVAAIGTSDAGGGGGAGGYSRKTVTSANVGTSQTVTVGAAGSGGAAGTNNGTAGTATSVGSLCVANGGSGGLYGATGAGGGGAGGGVGTGDIAAPGAAGIPGVCSTITTVSAYGGAGGNSLAGAGGGGPVATTGYTAGNAATGYGAGGSGGASNNSSTGAAGGNGSAGYVIITEVLI